VTRIVNAMTVDVEDYFHASAFDRQVSRPSWSTRESRVVPNTERLLEVFDRHKVKGTFFVLGWVAERFPSLVRSIVDGGHEVASHGFHHQLIYTLTPAQFREDVHRAKVVIEHVAGCEVRGYRAPSFSIVDASLWALDVLLEEGYTYDASMFPVRHHRYGIPDAPRFPHVLRCESGSMCELPAPTLRVGSKNVPIAGGGYFRLAPYWLTKRAIARVNQHDGLPVAFYIHPWEVDPGQPQLAQSRLLRWRHHVGIEKTLDRLEHLLRDFSFATASTVLATYRPQTVPAMVRLAHAK
jgi:polysaccharide deacetylase family protein (PEP-CTERM system associated)